MDDYVAAIDQDPVAGLQSFGAGRHIGVLERRDDALRQRSNMNVGAARGDNHDIREGGFAVQVDGDDVLAF